MLSAPYSPKSTDATAAAATFTRCSAWGGDALGGNVQALARRCRR